jgi:hypothetical protein
VGRLNGLAALSPRRPLPAPLREHVTFDESVKYFEKPVTKSSGRRAAVAEGSNKDYYSELTGRRATDTSHLSRKSESSAFKPGNSKRSTSVALAARSMTAPPRDSSLVQHHRNHKIPASQPPPHLSHGRPPKYPSSKQSASRPSSAPTTSSTFKYSSRTSRIV